MVDHPETPTDWRAWDEISKNLHKNEDKKLLPFWLWLPIGLFATGLLGYWLGQTKNIQPIKSQSDTQIDTVYITINNTISDTVIQEKYITKWKYKNVAFNEKQIISSEAYQNILIQKINIEDKLLQYQNTLSNNPIAYHPSFASLPGLKDLILQNKHIDKLNNPNSITDRIDGIKIESISPLQLALLKSKRRLIAGLDINKYPTPSLRSKQNIIDHIIPDYINIGASIEGPLLSLTEEGNFGTEFGIGLHAELLFSPKFSIITGVRTRNNTTSINDENNALRYSQPVEIDPGETFKGLNIKSSFLDIPLHFKYKYSAGKIDKYITTGILTTKISGREYIYEYYTTGGETYREVKGESSAWNIGTATLGIGFEYSFRNSFNLFAESYARYNFNTSPNEQDQFHGIGFRLGAVYEL